MDVVMAGTAMQAVGCLVSVGALVAWNAVEDDDGMKMPLLTLVILAGVVETLGAQLASVAVKKEWVPIVFDSNNDDGCNDTQYDEANEAIAAAGNKGRSLSSMLKLPPITLSFMNTTMTNIDLLCAMFGPVLAGWVLEVMGGDNDSGGVGHDEPLSMQRGFAAIALLNVVSFVPEIALLRKVYRSCPALQQRDGRGFSEVRSEANRRESEETDATCVNTKISNTGQSNEDQVDELINPWRIWFHHPSGLPLVSISLAALYLTALSPSGVVLTAYLITIGLSPTSIGFFRAIGAIFGLLGIGLFSLCRDNGNTEGIAGGSASARSIQRLRRISMAFLLLELISILLAAVAYFLCKTSLLLSISPSIDNDNNNGPLSWKIAFFLSAIVVSRAGLYSFDVGALEIEQYLVDERHRNAVGSVEGALCSMAEMGMYVLSIALPDPAQFGWQVGVSAAGVTTGAVCFGSFLYLYNMHQHDHHGHEDEDYADDGHDHNHYHHIHTLQQERDLKRFGYHIHLHRSPIL